MGYPFWLRDVVLGVTDSILESEALFARNARPPLHQRRPAAPAGGTVEPWDRVVERGLQQRNRGSGGKTGEGVRVEGAGKQAVELRIRAGKPETLAAKLWPWR